MFKSPVTEPNGYKVTTGPLENAHLCTCDVVTCRDPRPTWLPDGTVPASPVVAVDEFTLCDYATMKDLDGLPDCTRDVPDA